MIGMKEKPARKPKPPKSWTPKAIMALRTRLDLTQTEFANELGVSLRTVQYWEKDETVPTKLASNALDALNARKS